MKKALVVWAAMAACISSLVQPANAEPPAACALDQRYPGVYPNDPWPRGEVALTFDDGPYPGATTHVLDRLKKHGLVATFFVVGVAIRRDTYPVIQRMVAEGHSIGTHTYSHDLAMTSVSGADPVENIEAQYALTQLCVEIALLARSPDHFDELYRRVFARKPGRVLGTDDVRAHFREFEARHLELLGELGYDAVHRPYRLRFARPPGGIPYFGSWKNPAFRRNHEAALRELGLVNVLWHGGSGDTDAERRNDFSFLVGSVRFHTRRGGVLVIHDRMQTKALDAALETIANDPKIKVVPLADAVERKYSCTLPALQNAIAGTTREVGRALAAASRRDPSGS